MALKLSRGQKGDVNTNHLVSKIVVGVGWDRTVNTPDDHIIDLTIYGLDEDDVCRRAEDIIYFFTPIMEGERTNVMQYLGPDEIITSKLLPAKDKEQIKIQLDDIPLRIESLLVCISVYESLENKYDLSQVNNIHLQIFNEENLETIIELDEYSSNYFKLESFLIMGKLFRFGKYWRFHNISEGYIGDMGTLHGIYLREGDDD